MATVVQKSRVSTETKEQMKALTTKGDTKAIVKGTSGATSLDLITNNILRHNTTATLSSGDIFQLLNNGTGVFQVDAQGAVHLYPRATAPTDNAEGTLYFDNVNDTLQISVEE